MFRPIVLSRILFVLVAVSCGYWLGYDTGQGANAAIVALIMSLLLVLFEYSLRTLSTKRIAMASVGLLFGLIVARLLYETIPNSIMGSSQALIACNLVFGYMGLIMALKQADHLNLGSLRFLFSGAHEGIPSRVIDTSVIIDGRIQDLIRGGFLPGHFIVPTFVIDELQLLADSGDSIKRGKGRRGLGILEEIQEECPHLEVLEKDYPDVRDVDRKLLELCKELDAQVVTNDFNLQKVASLHKVPVLNINEMADLLRPPVFVGETFPLAMVREGKEQSQGVGYLKDGTMVVVDDGRQFIGQEIEVVVTSILQTNTGRMVFARPVSLEGNGSNGRGG